MMKYAATLIRVLFLALFIFLMVSGKMLFWLALFGASLAVAPAFGRVYCGYVCPMNTLMIPVEWLSGKCGLQTAQAPKWLRKGCFPWVSLAISMAGMLLSRRLLRVELPVLPFWLVLSVLVTARYQPSVFHNLICPFGALQRAFGRFALRSKGVDETACIGCRLCEKACPSGAIAVSAHGKAVVDTSLCHQCTNCADVCPGNAVRYGRRGRATP